MVVEEDGGWCLNALCCPIGSGALIVQHPPQPSYELHPLPSLFLFSKGSYAVTGEYFIGVQVFTSRIIAVNTIFSLSSLRCLVF